MGKSVVLVRSAFAYDGDAVSDACGLECREPTLAVQSGKEEADINTLVRRFGLTGEFPKHLRIPMQGDFTGLATFHDALNKVRQAEEEFLRLPGEMRARFDHDPGKLIAFCSDKANRAEAVKLGLLDQRSDVAAGVSQRRRAGEAPAAAGAGSSTPAAKP